AAVVVFGAPVPAAELEPALEQGLAQVDAFLDRYRTFVVFDDVTLADLRPTLRLWSVQGPNAADALRAAGWVPPPAGRFATGPHPAPGGADPGGSGMVFGRVRTPAGGFDVVAPIDRPAPIAGTPIGAEAIEALRVLAGRPRFPDDTGDKRLPHELGLRDELLSFDKGCYLGQETINRVDVMGQVKRALCGIRFPGAAADGPAAGSELRVGGEVVGTLTSPVALWSGDLVGLAVVKRPAEAPGTEVVVERDGSHWRGRVEPLPFDVG
ncbi:MAG: hypothetical protein ABMB14_36065, partial [Myxococcota bacterium]